MSFEPGIVAFLCNWCSYTGADLAGTSRIEIPANIRAVRVMCSSRVEPDLVIKALTEGADGVLIAGCWPGDCHYQRGNYYTRRRVAMLHAVLESMNLEPGRVKLAWVAASEAPRYKEVTEEFVEQIKKLGPNPLKNGCGLASASAEAGA